MTRIAMVLCVAVFVVGTAAGEASAGKPKSSSRSAAAKKAEDAKRAEEAKRRRAELERKQAEEARRRKAEIERKQAEEAARKKAEAQKRADEEQKKKEAAAALARLRASMPGMLDGLTLNEGQMKDIKRLIDQYNARREAMRKQAEEMQARFRSDVVRELDSGQRKQLERNEARRAAERARELRERRQAAEKARRQAADKEKKKPAADKSKKREETANAAAPGALPGLDQLFAPLLNPQLDPLGLFRLQ